MPHGAAAQSPKLEAAYVVLGPQGAVARAVLSNTTQCPAITIDGARQAMNVRALPDTGPMHSFRSWSANCRSRRAPTSRQHREFTAARAQDGAEVDRRVRRHRLPPQSQEGIGQGEGSRRRGSRQVPGLQHPIALAVRAIGSQRGRRQARPRHPCRRLRLSRERLSAARPGLQGQSLRRRLGDLESRFLRPRRAGLAGGAMDRGARQSRNL